MNNTFRFGWGNLIVQPRNLLQWINAIIWCQKDILLLNGADIIKSISRKDIFWWNIFLRWLQNLVILPINKIQCSHKYNAISRFPIFWSLFNQTLFTSSQFVVVFQHLSHPTCIIQKFCKMTIWPSYLSEATRKY